ncbi:MAG: hypothetical protein A2W11_12175 [Ignavibacteria bacterium RBG_16_35_7]|nr:MAG: hypothetical protein A2W11_12175 [Ignavibacteria bacterium RBG_16_35_7]
MKTFLISVCLLSFSLVAYTQTLNIHKNGAIIQSIGLRQIDSITFTLIGMPCPGIPTVSYSGRIYNTVLVGDQCWLKENLNVGTMIQGSGDQSNNTVLEKYCYDNNENNCNNYGGLYQWDEAMQYATNEGAQGICPDGWHLPTLAEFETLKATVSDDGNALKAIGQGSGAGAGTNISGFSALLAGNGYFQSALFTALGETGTFQSSTEGGLGAAQLGLVSNDNSIGGLSGNFKAHGFSVRCIKD